MQAEKFSFCKLVYIYFFNKPLQSSRSVCYIYIYIYIYIYGSVLVNEMPKSARYHIDRANSTVFNLKKVATNSLFAPDDSSRMKQAS